MSWGVGEIANICLEDGMVGGSCSFEEPGEATNG